MRTANLSVRKAVSKGFSLVEMLVVIAIIGVIAAIAVPNISSLTNSANVSKDKRNAQNLASVCASAQAAGYDFVTQAAGGTPPVAPDPLDPEDEGTPGTPAPIANIIKDIVKGVTIEGGSFHGDYFGVPGLSPADQTAAAQFLTPAPSGVLIYNAGNKGQESIPD